MNFSGKVTMDIRQCYKILEVDYDASMFEIRYAYKNLVRAWHPDRFNNNPSLQKLAEERLKEINVAYGELKAFLSQKQDPGITAALIPLSRWSVEVIGKIVSVISLIGRDIYPRICSKLIRVDLGRKFQAVLFYGRVVAGLGRWKNQGQGPIGGRSVSAGNRIQKKKDFKSIFEEVAAEKKAQSNRKDRPNG